MRSGDTSLTLLDSIKTQLGFKESAGKYFLNPLRSKNLLYFNGLALILFLSSTSQKLSTSASYLRLS